MLRRGPRRRPINPPHRVAEDPPSEIDSHPVLKPEETGQWVSRIIRFSSEFSAGNWSAAQLVGPPKQYPAYGDAVGAWCTRGFLPDSKDFVEVGFEKPVWIRRDGGVEIYETLTPQPVSRILALRKPGLVKWAREIESEQREALGEAPEPPVPVPSGEADDGDDCWVVLWEGQSHQVVANVQQQQQQQSSVLFAPSLRKLRFPVDEIRIEYDYTGFTYYAEIDAVRLVGTLLPPGPPVCQGAMGKSNKALFRSGLFSDAVVVIRDVEIPVHRGILGSRSSFLNGMFAEDPEKRRFVWDHLEFDADVVRLMIEFLYSDHCIMQKNQILACSLLGKQFEIPEFESYCAEYFERALTEESVIRLTIEAVKLGCAKLRAVACRFVSENFVDVALREEFEMLPKVCLLEILRDYGRLEAVAKRSLND